jgi:nicotinate-nucleotide adenylyltransferase
MRRYTVYGGTFSPPHVGHASVIEAIARLVPCDEVLVMVSKDRDDKNPSVRTHHRLAMTELMIGEIFPSSPVPITVSKFELERPGLLYTYDTLLALLRTNPGDEFFITVSSELLRDMTTTWEKGRELFNTARFIVSHRPGTPLTMDLPPMAIVIGTNYAHIDVSSTFIRGLIGRGLSGMPYLTPAVARYIRDNRLYLANE